jgi:hypothetical protein
MTFPDKERAHQQDAEYGHGERLDDVSGDCDCAPQILAQEQRDLGRKCRNGQPPGIRSISSRTSSDTKA